MPAPRNLLGGHCCSLGQYNTNRTARSQYEPEAGAWALVPRGQLYLISLLVKLSFLITDADYEVYVVDTDLTPAQIIAGGLQALWDNGDYALAISDVKAIGGIFGVDPPTEEFLTRSCRCDSCTMRPNGHGDMMIPINRPIEKGLTVVLVDASDGSVSTETDAVWIDARYAFAALLG